MNLTAYFTTGLAIKLFSRLSKASIEVYGKENIPTGPTIFVMNHFTRVETFLLPSYIYALTGKPVLSLAASSLFKGGLGKFLDLVGAVSTSDPKRDELIIKSLLVGDANWIIFPEGNMVKTKKIIDGGKFMIADSHGMHKPHTGAAVLGLRAELYRRYLLQSPIISPDRSRRMLQSLGISNIDQIRREQISIQPVNLTYYPIRAAENIALDIASKLVKDMSERMVEEIMAEGTMMLSGVDLDIRCGQPIMMADYMDENWLKEEIGLDDVSEFFVSPTLKEKMHKPANDVMQRYMQDIYSMTTVNHEHLFASFLRMLPFNRINELDLKRRVYMGASLFGKENKKTNSFYLHKSLKINQAHLLTDDRYGKYENFLKLALEKGVVHKDGKSIVRDRSKLSAPLSFHKGRINNPIEIIANEVEPLKHFQFIVRSLSWQPQFLLRLLLARHLLRQENDRYIEACSRSEQGAEKDTKCSGKPFLLAGLRRRAGVVLIHSYLAVPEEVKALARYLRRRGMWVYAPRLPGHGTTALELSQKKYQEWVESVENAYVLMGSLCDRVVVGGMAIGGNLALDLASRVRGVAGVFAVCPPFSLKDYSTNFRPPMDVWNRILNKMKQGEHGRQFFEFSHGNLHVNYSINPVATVKEIGDFLESIENNYVNIRQPALIIQADQNPIVDPKGSLHLYNNIGSVDKEFSLLSDNKHILVAAGGDEKVFRKIGSFIANL